MEPILETPFNSIYGRGFTLKVYTSKPDYAEHIALIKGDISKASPVLVRMHALDVLNDVLGDTSLKKGSDLSESIKVIDAHGSGVVVLIREPRKTMLSDRVRMTLEKGGSAQPLLRDYGIGAQILLDLGVKEMILLSNSKRQVVGLEGYGLEIKGYRGIR